MGRRTKMRFRFSVLSVALAAAAAIVLAVGQTAAQAAPVSAQQAAAVPDTSGPFSISLAGGCGKWSGTLDVHFSGGDGYGDISGTLHAGCNGGSTGHFWYSCNNGTNQNPKTWTTQSSESTSYGMTCETGSLVIWAELCYQGPNVYACANSPKRG
jgi:hypothetical protein